MRRVVATAFVLSVLVAGRAFAQDGRPVIVNDVAGTVTMAPSGSIAVVNGNVGVGNAAPSVKLDVTGQVNASGGLCISGDCKTTWPAAGGSSQWTTSGTNISYVTGNVGIGTTNLSGTRFYVAVADANYSARFDSPATGGSYGPLIRAGTNSLDYSFHIQNGAATSNYLVVRGDGNVGVGTTAQQARLHVIGDIKASGNIAALYQDVAEWVEASQPIAAGTVVMTDPNRDNGVRMSAGAYQTSVAGVVSAQPGVLLGEASASKVAVAQSGRVKVRVDASYGEITRGDLLVTSPRDGYAMKSQPVDVGGVSIHRPGTILGKALEPLASGTGEILVLLTLQ